MQKMLLFLRRVAPAVAAGLLVALLLRLLCRDRYWFSAPSFYALPFPLQLAGWLWLAGLWWKPQRLKAGACIAMAPLMAILWTVQTKQLCREIPPPATPGPRVFFWNIGHIKAVPPALHTLLDELSPDVVGLAEAENLGPSGHAELRTLHPDYHLLPLPVGMVCMVKGHVLSHSFRELPQRSVVQVLGASLTRFPGPWRICLTDIGPLPPLPRHPLLSEVFKDVTGHPRTIVMGDFNTPLDSAAFEPWRESFHHGFADCTAWHGPLETWAYGLPILSIDHIWMSRDLTPAAAQKGARRWQDHSWIMVDCGS